jgi:chromosome segregation ATPase
MLSCPRGLGLALLLAALGLGGGIPAAQEETVDLRPEVEDLVQRIQGMEGKLRESAAARKAADQARMEAERRLAEGAQELGRLRAEVSLLQDAKLALEARLRRAEEQAGFTAQGLLAAEESARRIGAERDAEAAGKATLELQVDQLIELQRQTDESGLARLRALTQERSDVGRLLAESESDLKRVRSELRAAQAERDALRRRLDAQRLASPDLAADAANLEEAQIQAAAAAATLHEALAGAPDTLDPGARRAVRAVAQELHRRQLQVARLLGARSVYRVGPGDSFPLIAGRFYGDDRRWPEIHEANRRVVPDPAHLVPGLTLVIP